MKYEVGQFVTLKWNEHAAFFVSTLRRNTEVFYAEIMESSDDGIISVLVRNNINKNKPINIDTSFFDIEVLDIDRMQFRLLSE